MTDAMESVGDWRIDTSAGCPILVYQNCSVIESEQAQYLLRLIAEDTARRAPKKSLPKWGSGRFKPLPPLR